VVGSKDAEAVKVGDTTEGADEEEMIVGTRLGLLLGLILGATVGPSLGLSVVLRLGEEDAVVLGEKLGL
jgi:hypothetical protein